MFVDSMDRPEKQALLEVLSYLASVDGELSPEEVAFIEQTADELDLEASEALERAGEIDLEELLTPLKGEPRHQRAVMLELVRLAHADERFSLEELVVIEEIATIFGLDERTLGAIKDWVEKELEWRREGQRLVDQGP